MIYTQGSLFLKKEERRGLETEMIFSSMQFKNWLDWGNNFIHISIAASGWRVPNDEIMQ